MGQRGRQEYISSTNPLTILKVKLMEIHPLHEVTKGFWLKGSEAWVTNLPAEKRARGGVGGKNSLSGLNGNYVPSSSVCLSHRRLASGYTRQDSTPQGQPAESLSCPALSPMSGQ